MFSVPVALAIHARLSLFLALNNISIVHVDDRLTSKILLDENKEPNNTSYLTI